MTDRLSPASLPDLSPKRPLILPRRLRAGDTLGLINPSGAVFENAPYQQAQRALLALGFQVREAPHARSRRCA